MTDKREKIKLVGGGYIQRDYTDYPFDGQLHLKEEFIYDKVSGISKRTRPTGMRGEFKVDCFLPEDHSGHGPSLEETYRKDGSLARRKTKLFKNENDHFANAFVEDTYDEKGTLRERTVALGKKYVYISYDEKGKQIKKDVPQFGDSQGKSSQVNPGLSSDEIETILKATYSKERMIKKALSEVQEKPKTNLLGMLKRLLPKTKVKKTLEMGSKSGATYLNSGKNQSR